MPENNGFDPDVVSEAWRKSGFQIQRFRNEVRELWLVARKGCHQYADPLYEREYVREVRAARAQGTLAEVYCHMTWAARFKELAEMPFERKSVLAFTAAQPPSGGVLPAAYDPRPLIQKAVALGVKLELTSSGVITATPAGMLPLNLRKLLVDHAREIAQALRSSEVLR